MNPENTNDTAATEVCAPVAGSVIRPPNLVQIGVLWICEDEDQVMPDKIEFALLIQCSSAEQCRAAMKAGKIEFTIFEHYSQNVQAKPCRAAD
jgi:hypothetical protein